MHTRKPHRTAGLPARAFSAILLLALLFSPFTAMKSSASGLAQPPQAPGLTISAVTSNLAAYPNGQVPANEKLELTFQVGTSAQNPQFPYDANPPAGIQPGIGVSVDGLFTQDNWATTYTQPAFLYQAFDDQVKSGREWFYPTTQYSWKVRFAPTTPGNWQYKIRARDAAGVTETQVYSFTTGQPGNKGFVRVSPTDSRYFEFRDGTYFPSLGYNMNYDDISWTNPVIDNEANFRAMGQNGIQLVRMWLSQWSIYGSAWNPWMTVVPDNPSLPYTGLLFREHYGSSDVSMEVNAEYNTCQFIGWNTPHPAVKPNTSYRVRVRYKAEEMRGPRVAGQPFGFGVKIGDWLWDDANHCKNYGTGTMITPLRAENTPDWTVLEGTFKTGSYDFLPFLYLAAVNMNTGWIHVDSVYIEEDLGGGQYGANLINKWNANYHLYYDQRQSYAFDKVLDLAHQYGVYLRPVVLEKNDWLWNRINYDGTPILDDERCYDQDPSNNPACPGNQYFYGNWGAMTKVKWLQQAYWRYLQARWGYSPNIHSWELVNEGDPYNGQHYTLANDFARYMHQFAPDDHLVSTSFWHSFPKDEFWANPSFADVDFADVHQYVEPDDPLFGDTAKSTYDLSMQVGARQPGGAGKPVIRGETGLEVGTSQPSPLVATGDTQGLWLHNLIWAGINPGGLIESYWYEEAHIYKYNGATPVFDHRWQYRTFYNFISGIPLNNGRYVDAAASVSNANLRAWGQKDVTGGRAHLWISNKANTWQAAANHSSVAAQSGTVTVGGFRPSTSYTVKWYDTFQPDPAKAVIKTETALSNASGTITLTITSLTSDTAVQVAQAGGPTLPPKGMMKTFLPGLRK